MTTQQRGTVHVEWDADADLGQANASMRAWCPDCQTGFSPGADGFAHACPGEWKHLTHDEVRAAAR